VGVPGRSFVLGDIGLPRGVASGVIGALIAMSICQAVLYLTLRALMVAFPGFSPPEHQVIEVLRSPDRPAWLPVTLWVTVACVTPIAEELFFRGMLQTTLWRVMNSRASVILASGIIFGVAHSDQPQVMPAIALFGCILGFMYERSGSLVPSIVAHALFNTKTLLWEMLGGG
jgi:membrane protease YdiL (CAAX protease family)